MPPVQPNYEKDFIHIPERPRPPISTMTVKPEPRRHPVLRFFAWLFFLLIVGGIGGGLYVYKKIITPVDLPGIETNPIILNIPSGANLNSITAKLTEKHLISSPFIFRAVMLVTGKETSVKTGDYTFKRPMNMFDTIQKLVNAQYEYTPVKLTIKEGEDSKSIASTVSAAFPKFATTTVYETLRAGEGRIFPETYSFAPFATFDEILKAIDKEFQKRIEKYKVAIASSTFTETEILTIASILEKEVPRPSDMKMVAGIIYNRLKKGMPLQMDSTLGYVTGKASLELTTEDLKIDSVYNTYVNTGLPPTPIGNPGDKSLEATLNPEKHDYFFFLSDKNGDNHYAKTYAEHLKNRKTYLDK